MDTWEPVLLEEIMPAKLHGFYLKRDKTHYMYLDNDVVLAVPDELLVPTAEGAEYIRRSVDGVNIKFFSRGVLSEVEALTREEFDDIVEMSNDNLVFRAWTTPENYTILIQLSRYYRNNNIPYKRGVIIQLTEELLKNPPLSDVPEVMIRRDIPNPQFATFGKV